MLQNWWIRLPCAAMAGVLVSFVGLALAGSVGHWSALTIGFPASWFEVDFNEPRAIKLAVTLEILLISVGYLLLAGVYVSIKAASSLTLWAAANPLVSILSFFLYKAIKPFEPEHAYYSPESLLALALSFPGYWLAARFGMRVAARIMKQER